MRQAIEKFIIRSGYYLKNKIKFKAITLKQKFEEATDGWIVADKCEEIADNYAIDFAEWVEELSRQPFDSLDYHLYLDNDMKKLLEIFKEIKKL